MFTVAAAVTVTAVLHVNAAIYTGGQGDGWGMDAMASDVDLGGPKVTIASTVNLSFVRGYAPAAISTITITDAVTPGIKSGTSIVVRIPAGFAMMWDEADLTATFGGTAVGKVGPISYAGSNKRLVIAVTADFATGDTLTVGGLSFKNYVGLGTDRLELDFNNDGLDDADDARTVTILGGFHHGGLQDSYALDAMVDDRRLQTAAGAVFMFVRHLPPEFGRRCSAVLAPPYLMQR